MCYFCMNILKLLWRLYSSITVNWLKISNVHFGRPNCKNLLRYSLRIYLWNYYLNMLNLPSSDSSNNFTKNIPRKVFSFYDISFRIYIRLYRRVKPQQMDKRYTTGLRKNSSTCNFFLLYSSFIRYTHCSILSSGTIHIDYAILTVQLRGTAEILFIYIYLYINY